MKLNNSKQSSGNGVGGKTTACKRKGLLYAPVQKINTTYNIKIIFSLALKKPF